jgi:hypothetical protein
MLNFTEISRRLLSTLGLAAGLGLATAGCAHAGGDADVFWSFRMSQPGVHVGVSNFPAPVVVHAPRPVVVYPHPVYVPPRVIHAPAYPVWGGHPGYGGYRSHGHGHWHDRHDRRERWDDRRHDHRGGRWDDRRDDHRGGHERGGDRHSRGGGRGGHDLHMGNQR